MKKKNIKGFTLVELLVVIAILAILATVTVVGYIAFTDKADRSVDEQTVEQLNTVLQASEVSDGKPVNPSDAMAILEENGFNIENYEAVYSKNTIYWDSSTNRILIYTEGEGVTFPEDAIEKYSEVVASNLPKYWYQIKDAYTITLIEENASSSEILDQINALEDGETLQLQSDIAIDFALNDIQTNNVEIDLNGNKLISKYSETNEVNNNITFRNGNLDLSAGPKSTKANLSINAGHSLTLDSVSVISEGSTLYPRGDAAQVNVLNSQIVTSGVYAVATNAAREDNYNVIINLENSTFKIDSDSPDNCAVFVNVPSTLNIDNCIIQGDRQGVVVRAGTANIENSTITLTNKYVDNNNYESAKWGSGNEVPMGALVIGNYDSTADPSYKANAIVNLNNVKLFANDGGRTCYIDANSIYYAKLTYDENSVVGDIIKGQNPDYIHINE